jgi:hypothetical protein
MHFDAKAEIQWKYRTMRVRRLQRIERVGGSITTLSTEDGMPEPFAPQTKQPAAQRVCYTEA